MVVQALQQLTPSPTGETTKLSKPVMIGAGVVLLLFILLTLYLYSLAGEATETDWHRMVFLYGPIEAIALAAAGYLFGREVHRAQADHAEKRAEQKTQEAEDSKNKGYQLKGMILGKSRNAVTARGSLDAFSPGETRGLGELDDLAATAERLFP